MIKTRSSPIFEKTYAYLYLFGSSPNIQGQRVAEALVMKQCMISISSTATIEAMQANVEARVIILKWTKLVKLS